jgi:hypothetical protein
MEGARATWNDGRLDDLSGRVSSLEKRMDLRFDHLESRFDSLKQAMIITLASILAGFAGLIAVIKI